VWWGFRVVFLVWGMERKVGQWVGGTEKWSILWGHFRVVHFFRVLKSGPFWECT